jgi:hypothetical protein
VPNDCPHMSLTSMRPELDAYGLRAQGRLHSSPPDGLGFGAFGERPHARRALLNIGQRGRRRAKGFMLIWFPYSNVRSPLG